MRISFMRWRPGSDGREPRERRKWLEINGVPSRARFRMFIRNRLWIGLPPAFVAGFGVVLLLLVSGGESTPERSLVRASIAGSLCVFGWILGVWAATGILEGDVPSAYNPPSGCKFHTRCPYATDRCRQEAPVLQEVEKGHKAACHRALELA